MSRKHRSRRGGVSALLIVLILLMIAATALVIFLCVDIVNRGAGTATAGSTVTLPGSTAAPSETETDPPETTLPEPEHVVTTATIGSMGDLLMHMPIFDYAQYRAQCGNADGTYDFTTVFQYLKDYVTPLDYAVANLETTLCGLDNGYSYSGYPNFNCPDEIVEYVKDAGFDMLLTANNHSYDTSLVGYKRTLEVVREAGLETLGTMLSADEAKYSIQEINGIKIGMICYTYANYATAEGLPSLNGNSPVSEAGITNYFTYDNLSGFYTELEGYLNEMKQAGAEATILYIHWGTEYQLTPSDTQASMAQSLCDLGIDVIIGGHPHVVQPMDLLTSTVDDSHKTVILYSMGNAVSNQRLGFTTAIQTAHTEDGVLFSVTFEKYSDGTVYLSGVEVLPTWVNKFTNSSSRVEYNILPLDESCQDQWQTSYSLTDSMYQSAVNSYQRTMNLVGEGLSDCQSWLEQCKQEREDYYYDLAMNPEKYAETQAAQETTEQTAVPTDAAQPME